jgi:hypothetical protein
MQSVMRRLCAKARIVDEAIEQALASIKSPVTADNRSLREIRRDMSVLFHYSLVLSDPVLCFALRGVQAIPTCIKAATNLPRTARR